jgi:hypothetical protein
MLEQTMKQGLTFSLLLVTTCLLGQVEIPRYDFDKVKGVDSIVARGTSGRDSFKEVFYYRNNRRSKANYYFNRDLEYYRLYDYDDLRQLAFESYYGKSYGYDSNKDEQTEFWDPSSYPLTINRFSRSLLIEQKNCNVNGSDTTVNQLTTYTYDSKGRILNEVTRDVFVGLVGSFKSNSVDLKELGEKNETIVYSKTYKYHLDTKIEVLYRVNETLTGKEIVGLNSKKQVTSINQYDQNDILLSETTALYDEKGRLKSITWKTHSSISIWGQEGDVVSDGTETIEYDNLGRPSETVTIYIGAYKTKIEYKYY